MHNISWPCSYTFTFANTANLAWFQTSELPPTPLICLAIYVGLVLYLLMVFQPGGETVNQSDLCIQD